MKTSKSIAAVLGALLFAGAVYAAVPWTAIHNAVWVKSKLYVGPAATVTTTANHMTKSLGARLDYVFPTLVTDGGTNACVLSPTVSVPGATIGDPCFLGAGYGLTQVVTSELVADKFDCFVTATDTVKVRRCGSPDAPALADAGYTVRVISSQ